MRKRGAKRERERGGRKRERRSRRKTEKARGREREREKKREREREEERERDRKRHRQTDRDTDRQTQTGGRHICMTAIFSGTTILTWRVAARVSLILVDWLITGVQLGSVGRHRGQRGRDVRGR